MAAGPRPTANFFVFSLIPHQDFTGAGQITGVDNRVRNRPRFASGFPVREALQWQGDHQPRAEKETCRESPPGRSSLQEETEAMSKRLCSKHVLALILGVCVAASPVMAQKRGDGNGSNKAKARHVQKRQKGAWPKKKELARNIIILISGRVRLQPRGRGQPLPVRQDRNTGVRALSRPGRDEHVHGAREVRSAQGVGRL